MRTKILNIFFLSFREDFERNKQEVEIKLENVTNTKSGNYEVKMDQESTIKIDFVVSNCGKTDVTLHLWTTLQMSKKVFQLTKSTLTVLEPGRDYSDIFNVNESKIRCSL